jgi:hypothetical protein
MDMTTPPNSTESEVASSNPPGSREDVLQLVKEDRNYKPLRSSHASLMGGDLASGVPYVIKSEITGEEYNVDFFTVTIWWLLDGEHTISQVVGATEGRFDSSYETILEAVSFLGDEGLLAGTEPEVASSRRLKFVSAFELDYTITWKNSLPVSRTELRLQEIVRKCYNARE